ncbi:hypothetical protein MHBO_001880 [Bonamia ostreae]|uniref:Uncharacterized protein n=1 Tax=Bonamia ostreae TaxID=126728 RepID=A0ABV2ALK1_9EUKA
MSSCAVNQKEGNCCGSVQKCASGYSRITNATKEIFDECLQRYSDQNPIVRINLKGSDRCSTSFKIEQKDELRGLIEQKVKIFDKTNMKLSLSDDQKMNLVLQTSQLVPNSCMSVNLHTHDSTKFNFGYCHRLFSTNLEILKSICGHISANPSLVVTYKNMSVGTKLSLKADWPYAKMVNDLNFAASYRYKKTVASIYTTEKASKLNAEMTHRLCEGVLLGFSLSSDYKKLKETEARFGAKIKCNDNFEVRAMMGSDGKLSSAFSHRLSENMAMSVFSRLNLLDKKESAKVGLLFDLNADVRCKCKEIHV